MPAHPCSSLFINQRPFRNRERSAADPAFVTYGIRKANRFTGQTIAGRVERLREERPSFKKDQAPGGERRAGVRIHHRTILVAVERSVTDLVQRESASGGRGPVQEVF